MPDKVWSRFEKKKGDGTTLKLRIQDLPAGRLNDVIEIMVQFHARDEPVHKAIGIHKSSIAVANYRQFLEYTLNDPSIRIVICCSDDSETVKDIMGVSIIDLTAEDDTWDEIKEMADNMGDEVSKKLFNFFYDAWLEFDPVKEYSLKSYYDDKAVLVVPDYRRLGIAGEFLKVRRLMCEAHGIPMTGAWMTTVATQKAAAKDGWETVKELKYQDLAKKYDVTFTDVPPTMKLMVAKVNK